MRFELGPESRDAEKLLPPARDDGSGVGINYADVYIRSMKTNLADGRKVSCKRRGLKLTLSVGDVTGDGLLRRLENGPDEKQIVHRALQDAAKAVGASFVVENGVMFLELP